MIIVKSSSSFLDDVHKSFTDPTFLDDVRKSFTDPNGPGLLISVSLEKDYPEVDGSAAIYHSRLINKSMSLYHPGFWGFLWLNNFHPSCIYLGDGGTTYRTKKTGERDRCSDDPLTNGSPKLCCVKDCLNYKYHSTTDPSNCLMEAEQYKPNQPMTLMKESYYEVVIERNWSVAGKIIKNMSWPLSQIRSPDANYVAVTCGYDLTQSFIDYEKVINNTLLETLPVVVQKFCVNTSEVNPKWPPINKDSFYISYDNVSMGIKAQPKNPCNCN